MGAVSTAFVQQYSDMIKLLTQQRGTKLRGSVEVDTNFTGEFKFYDQLGATEMIEKTTRHQDTPIIDADHQRRRISKRDFIHNILLDEEDQLKMIVDPKSKYARSAIMAAGRKMDDLIIQAYNGTAYAGKNGGTPTAFDANFSIAAGGTGLTKAKVLEAKELLDDEDVEAEERVLVCTPKQITNLLNTTEVSSSDYNTVKTLVDGEIDTWLGFKFISISSKRLLFESGSTTVRDCYAYQKGAMQLAISREPTVNIDKRPDKNYATQVHTAMTIDATRLEEERIVKIKCDESV